MHTLLLESAPLELMLHTQLHYLCIGSLIRKHIGTFFIAHLLKQSQSLHHFLNRRHQSTFSKGIHRCGKLDSLLLKQHNFQDQSEGNSQIHRYLLFKRKLDSLVPLES